MTLISEHTPYFSIRFTPVSERVSGSGIQAHVTDVANHLTSKYGGFVEIAEKAEKFVESNV